VPFLAPLDVYPVQCFYFSIALGPLWFYLTGVRQYQFPSSESKAKAVPNNVICQKTEFKSLLLNNFLERPGRVS